MSNEMHNIFGHLRLDDRQEAELIGVSRGLIADGVVNELEAEFLEKWLVATAGITGNPIIGNLLRRVKAMLVDRALDADETRDLFETLERFTGGAPELGEVLKSTTLPLDDPPPEIHFNSARFCVTGTFAFGPRRECEAAIQRLGGICGSLTLKTNYLVVGIYATESWSHSAYGRKIEKAVEMKQGGHLIGIVGEQHWIKYVRHDNV
jgi:NAD-dependent DNA ligase